MRNTYLIIFILISIIYVSILYAFDNGPQILACDYKLGDKQGTEMCLIEGSGVNQGISWVVFEISDKKFRYYSTSPNRIEHIDSSYNIVDEYPVTNIKKQCRPGGREADVYEFKNGDRICIYW